MNQLELREALTGILSLAALDEVFAELRATDPAVGANIETALRNQLAETHQLLAQAEGSTDRLRYALYREGVELNAHVASFLRYSETMAQREAALWKFALDATDRFFDLAFDALDEYFTAKRSLLEDRIDVDATWYTGLRDTAKKTGVALNLAKKGIARALNRFADADLDEEDVVDARTVVERLLAEHLGPEVVEADVTHILEEASRRYEEAWRQQIEAQTPDLAALRAFAGQGADSSALRVGFELGRAEQALAIGLGGAVVGTLGLAAGWHTITYALLHVFPPAALFAVLATMAVAFWTKEKAAKKRKQAAADAVKEYHRHFLTQIDTAPIEALGGRSLRRAMTDQAKVLISKVMARWNEAISGKLTVDHYRRLIAAASAHLGQVDLCLKALDRG